MIPKYNGKTPGRFWYFRQRTAAFIGALAAKPNRADAKGFGRNTSLAIGSLATGIFVFSNVTLVGVPTIVLGVGLVLGSAFGIKARRDFKDLKRSSTYLNSMRARENKWLAQQKKPKLLARIGAGFTRLGAAIGWTLAAAGAALGTAAGLQAGGVISATALSTVLGGAATAVSLPALITVGALAVPAGIVAAITCRRATRRLLGTSSVKKKAAAPVQSINTQASTFTAKPVANDFSQSAAPAISEERKRAQNARRNKFGPGR